MNIEKIKSIFKSHNLQYGGVEKSTTGFINEVYLTENYVVKLYAGKNKSGYQKELWFYQNVNPFYAPSLISYGSDYIIMERIYGSTGFFRLWRDMNDCERQKTVEKIAEIINHINSVDYHSAEDIFEVQQNFKAKILRNMERIPKT